MTTVVISCVSMEVAADGQTTSHYIDNNGGLIDHTVHYKQNNKVFKLDNGQVFVGSGCRDSILHELESVIETGCLSKKPRGEYTIAIVQKKGDHLHVDIHESNEVSTWYGRKHYKVDTKTVLSNTDIITFGSGGKYAFAGMKAGLTARDSVLLAAKCDKFTNTNVTVENLKDDQE